MLKNIRQYLRGIKSPSHRLMIHAALKRRGARYRGMNDAERQILQDAIFEVENEVEHSLAESTPQEVAASPMLRRRRETVAQMRIARNLVLDDLGWNEDASKDATEPIAA